MKRLRLLLVPVFMVLLGAVLLAGCGGSDGDSAPPCAAPTVDVNGTWYISRTVVTDGCYSEYNYADMPMTIYQSGNTVTVPGADISTGTLCGNVITFSGSYADGSGTTSETLIFTVSGTSFSGSGSWSWTGAYTCSGSDSYSGYKL